MAPAALGGAGNSGAESAAGKLQRFAHDPQTKHTKTAPAKGDPPSPTAPTQVSKESHPTHLDQNGADPMHQATPVAGHKGGEGSSAEPTLCDLLSAITQCNANITKVSDQVQGLQSEINIMRHEMQKVRDRTTEAEDRISAIEDSLQPLARDVKHVAQNAEIWLNKADHLDNRQRRNNIRIVGIPEKVEGHDPISFVENWLADNIGRNTLTPMFMVESAQRIPTRAPPPGAPPRPMIIKLLTSRNKHRTGNRQRKENPATKWYEGLIIPRFFTGYPIKETEIHGCKTEATHAKCHLCYAIPSQATHSI